MAVDKDSKTERYLLLIWSMANLIVGILVVHDFGVSFDEPRYYIYAEQSLDSYRSFFGLLYEPDYGPGNLQYYGPSFIILVELVARILQSLFTNMLEIDIWHFSYFVLFQLTGLALYSLIKRWFSRWTAWAVLLLFTAQPLLWGHAFMNPKDIPFMGFMVFSVFAGYKVLDSFEGRTPELSLQTPIKNFSEAWDQIDSLDRKRYMSLLFIEAGLLVLSGLSGYLIAQIVTFFYLADPNTLPEKIFHTYAQTAGVPLESYISRAQTLFHRFADPILILGVVVLLVYLGNLLIQTSKGRLFLDALKRFSRTVFPSFQQAGNFFKLTNVLNFVRQTILAMRAGNVIFAGLILGLTISIRVLGPLAGLIVIICWLVQARSKALPVIIAYLLWAGLIAYLTWPYLWGSAVSRYFESLAIMSNFPWPGRVLFNGHLYRPHKLPFEYLPVLLNIQFTEPLLVSFYVGFIGMVWSLLKKRVPVDLLAFVGLSFIIPLILLISLRMQLYDNFRQILFILPGAFVIAGAGLEAFLSRLRSGWTRVALILVFAIPGMYSILTLHPYQYIYYNSLVGGTPGAARRYEMDYWRTSYRELALQVNQLASQDAHIFVSGAPFPFEPYARPDLNLEHKIIPNQTYDFEYAVLTSRWDTDERLFPDADIVMSVERDGAVFSMLKYVKNQALK